MKNKSLMLFSVLAVLLLVASGCSNSPTGGAVSGKEVVKVGVLAALTGDVATIGESSTRAIELAAEEFNAKDTEMEIKLVIEDTKCDGAVSATAANKLVNVDKVEVILGALCSGATIPAIPIAENNKVVMFSPCSSAPSISEMGDYMFRNYPSDSYQTVEAADYIYNTLGKRKAAVIYSNTDWGFGLQEAFEEAFTKLGGEIVAIESAERESQDLRSQLTKVKAKSPDVLFTALYSQNQGLVMKQGKELGINIPVIGCDAAIDPNTVAVAGDAAEGLMAVALTKTESPAFEAKLKERKGVNVELCTPTAYDAAHMVFAAIKRAGNDGDKVKDLLYRMSFKGLTGTTKFDSNGDRIGADYSTYKVVNGEFVIIE